MWKVSLGLISCAAGLLPAFARAESAGAGSGEIGATVLAGREADPEFPEAAWRNTAGGSLSGSLTAPLSSDWYLRGFASGTGVDSQWSGWGHGHAGASIGRRDRYAEVAAGIALASIGGPRGGTAPVPTLFARIGRLDGVHGSVGLVDERGPLHGLAGVDLGVGSDDGTDFSMGLTITEAVDLALWSEARFPVTERARLGVHVARGTGLRSSSSPHAWNSVGLRFYWSFGGL